MKVSILIPVYNSEKYLKECLISCINQTYTNIEIIVVDDGSMDNSLAVAKSFQKDDRVKVFAQKNKGACVARNLAFEKSSGQYIQYLDADDIISANKIEDQLSLIQGKRGVVSSCQWDRFYKNMEEASFPKRFLDQNWDDSKEWLIHSWLGKGMSANSCWLVPREIILKAGKWNEELKINQDGEFFCRILLKANSIKHTPEAKVYYRSGMEGSVSQGRKNDQKISSLLKSYKLYEKHVRDSGNFNLEMKKAVGHCYLSFIYEHSNMLSLCHESYKSFNKLNIGKPWAVGGGGSLNLFPNLLGLKVQLKY